MNKAAKLWHVYYRGRLLENAQSSKMTAAAVKRKLIAQYGMPKGIVVRPDPTRSGLKALVNLRQVNPRKRRNPGDDDYNGWKNKATWNVALWIGNDENLYNAAVSYMKRYPQSKRPYSNFIKEEGLDRDRTPDGFAYYGERLDYPALNEMMREMI